MIGQTKQTKNLRSRRISSTTDGRLSSLQSKYDQIQTSSPQTPVADDSVGKLATILEGVITRVKTPGDEPPGGTPPPTVTGGMKTKQTTYLAMALAVHHNLPIHHSDIAQAFIQTKLDRPIFISFPKGVDIRSDLLNSMRRRGPP